MYNEDACQHFEPETVALKLKISLHFNRQKTEQESLCNWSVIAK